MVKKKYSLSFFPSLSWHLTYHFPSILSSFSPFPLKNQFFWTKPPDIPKSLREMPESISWVIISVQSDTLSSRIICSPALWRPFVMSAISWHVINCERPAEDKHKIACFVPDITQHACTVHTWGVLWDTHICPPPPLNSSINLPAPLSPSLYLTPLSVSLLREA